MLKMTIADWIKRVNRLFEMNLYSDVEIMRSGLKLKTREITNFEFCLIPEEVSGTLDEPPIQEELTERYHVIDKSVYVYDQYLCKDINSRQASFVNNYDGQENHCISYFHHYVRDNKYCLNVYVRSMNFKTNFIFDCQTFNLMYSTIFERLKNNYNIKHGFIRVFVFSLHVYNDEI